MSDGKKNTLTDLESMILELICDEVRKGRKFGYKNPCAPSGRLQEVLATKYKVPITYRKVHECCETLQSAGLISSYSAHWDGKPDFGWRETSKGGRMVKKKNSSP